MPKQAVQPVPTASEEPGIFCRKCGYALIGLQSRNCPECGRGFDLANPRTFARRPPRSWIGRWTRRVVLLMVIVSLLAGLGLGWLWRGWQAEQKTIGQLQGLTANLEIRPIGPNWLGGLLGQRLSYLRDRVEYVHIFHRHAEEIEGVEFSSLGNLRRALFFDCELNDAILASVGGVKTLQDLDLQAVTIKDSGLTHLGILPRLTRLAFWGKRTDDATLVHVSVLKGLTSLSLQSTNITDAGLQHVRSLSALEELNLVDTEVTDAGLNCLKEMKSLRTLWVYRSRVTPAGVARLKAAIPSLVIYDRDSRIRR